MIDCTFKLVRFHTPRGTRYVGVAWEYAQGILITSRGDHLTYADARASLVVECLSRDCNLRWFDGEYFCDPDSGQLVAA